MTLLLQADIVSLEFNGNWWRFSNFRILSADGRDLGRIEEIGIHGLGRYPIGAFVGAFEGLRRHAYHVTDAQGSVIVRASGSGAWFRVRGAVLDPEGGLIARVQQAKTIGPHRFSVTDSRGRAVGIIERSAKMRHAFALSRGPGWLIALAYPVGTHRWYPSLFMSYRIEFQPSAGPTDRMIVLGAFALLYGPLVGAKLPVPPYWTRRRP